MLVALDAGHGGKDPGAVYNGRQEKDDNLKLALAVGEILQNNGVDVVYTRESDIYETPFKKATDANEADADYFISFHRNSSEYPNQYAGAEILVYDDSGIKSTLARNILNGIEQAGFKNLGVDERKDLVVLKRTSMPAVLIESGFINSDTDNELYDMNFEELAQGIADGIIETMSPSWKQKSSTKDQFSNIDMTVNDAEKSDRDTEDGMEDIMEDDTNNDADSSRKDDNNTNMNSDMINSPDGMPDSSMYDDNEERYMRPGSDGRCPCENVIYRVQVGAYRNRDSADRLLNSLLIEGFPAFIVYNDGLYKVQVGAFRNLSNAVTMEAKLRRYRYNTYITTK